MSARANKDEHSGEDDGAHRLNDIFETISARRDVRTGFTLDPVSEESLERILTAAHQAPSVGFSQPWDFLVIRDERARARVQRIVRRERAAYAATLPAARARAFAGLKVEAILETPVNIVVTSDATRGGRHVLGRRTQPRMASFSTACAVQNLWLAARAEGLGVGWVSFFDERELAAELRLPVHVEIVAYLCLGHVEAFGSAPELALAGWATRRPLSWAVHQEVWGSHALQGEKATTVLDDTLAAIAPLDHQAVAAARERQDRLTKPRGSLGVLEAVSIQLAGLAASCPPPIPEPAAVAVFAADHGVHAQGVTPWPQEVTTQMVANFLDGGAVINCLATQAGVEVVVVDVGVNAVLDPVPGLLPRKIRFGTGDISVGPAMTRDEAVAAVEVGIELARDLVAAGNRCLLTGDMGIANTTASAALIAAFTGATPADVTGRGTGVDDATLRIKVDVVTRALGLHHPDPADPIGVLAAVGGLEHAALAGFILGAAALRTPVVLDGVIAAAAALAAVRLAPDSVSAMLAGHRSTEPGAGRALEYLGLRALVDLDLRLGEGSGAVLSLGLVQSAARILRDVATFDSAGVTDKDGPPREAITSTAAAVTALATEDLIAEGPDADVLAADALETSPRRVLVLGGTRSGKSAHAEALLRDAPEVDYIATASRREGDAEWAERIRRHRERRPAAWRTIETLDPAGVLAADHPAALLDSVTSWLAAAMDDSGFWNGDTADLDKAVDRFVTAWSSTSRPVVAVSDEVGSGVVPGTASGRAFRDALGSLNQRLAASADQVWLVTAGIARRLR
jgi:nicotinate-nucleotide--dimethylbenzimidazole phosphoribosyltransferase